MANDPSENTTNKRSIIFRNCFEDPDVGLTQIFGQIGKELLKFRLVAKSLYSLNLTFSPTKPDCCELAQFYEGQILKPVA
jgi:hypothetical protein